MNRFICFLLTLSIIFCLGGCKSGKKDIENPVTFYYPRSQYEYFDECGVIGSEIRDSTMARNNSSFLINIYLKGPRDADLISPFPESTSLISQNLTGNTLSMVLSSEISELSGIELTTALTCLAITCLDYYRNPDIQTIKFSGAGCLLGGSQWIELNRNELFLTDDSVDQLKNGQSLYLIDKSGKNLIERTVTINLTSGNSTCTELINMLLLSDENDTFSPIPDGTIPMGISISEGICTVNLSSEFLNHVPADSSAQYLSLQGITNTLAQLNYVEGVIFYCEGKRIEHYGVLDTSAPWQLDERCVLSQNMDNSYFTADFCLPTENNPYLIPISIPFAPSQKCTKSEQVLKALIAYEPCNGFHNPIPKNTKILSVQEYGKNCIVDLSGDFLTEPETVKSSVQVILATLYSLPDIVNVQITVDGVIPKEPYGDYFVPRTPHSGWYAE